MLWQRMAALGGNNKSEFLSDHPSDETRIKQIQGWLPEAKKYYKPTGSVSSSKSSVKSSGKTIKITSKKNKK